MTPGQHQPLPCLELVSAFFTILLLFIAVGISVLIAFFGKELNSTTTAKNFVLKESVKSFLNAQGRLQEKGKL